MGIPLTAIDDLMTAQYPHHMGKRQWKELTQDRRNYIVTEQFLSTGKFGVAAGPYLQWMVNTASANNATYSELYSRPSFSISEGLKKARVDWCKYENTMVYDIDEEGFQGGPEELLSMLTVRTHMMEMETVEFMENALWNVPTSSSESPMSAWGIPYWIVKNSTAAFGFNGGNHANFSGGPGGLSSLTYSRWKNGTFTYQKIDQVDFVKKTCEALYKCGFKSPVAYNELDGGPANHTLITTYPVVQTCQDLLTNSNDNLKMDLGKYRDKVLIRGIPLYESDSLTNSAMTATYDSTNPIFGIDWTNFRMFFKKGAERRYQYVKDTQQPNVRKTIMDGWFNFICTDRRKHFVGYAV